MGKHYNVFLRNNHDNTQFTNIKLKKEAVGSHNLNCEETYHLKIELEEPAIN